MAQLWRVAHSDRYDRRMLGSFAAVEPDFDNLDLREWSGQWVAVKNAKVVDAAATSAELMSRLATLGSQVAGAVVRFVEPPDEAMLA